MVKTYFGGGQHVWIQRNCLANFTQTFSCNKSLFQMGPQKQKDSWMKICNDTLKSGQNDPQFLVKIITYDD